MALVKQLLVYMMHHSSNERAHLSYGFIALFFIVLFIYGEETP